MDNITSNRVSRFHTLYTVEENSCWRWNSAQENKYGQYCAPYWEWSGLAHRFSYMAHKGQIPVGMFVRHTCDYKPCVNPDHLILGTNADNMQDIRDRYPGRKVVTGSGEEHYHSKLTQANVIELRERLRSGETTVEVAATMNVSTASISRAAVGITWGFVPGVLKEDFLQTKGSRHGATKKLHAKIEEQERTGLKYCKPCDSSKSLSEFGKNKRMLDGLAKDCKECSRTRRNKIYKKKKAPKDKIL